jgi:hypothetical protein
MNKYIKALDDTARRLNLHLGYGNKLEEFLTIVDGTLEEAANELASRMTVKAVAKAVAEARTEERIICSAVKFRDKVWKGHRHVHALDAMHSELSYTMNRKEMLEAQTDKDTGFVTSTGRYVDREEAWYIAKKAGQIIEREHQREGCLYSEDIY